jgi:preprotein translocase subunit YajC
MRKENKLRLIVASIFMSVPMSVVVAQPVVAQAPAADATKWVGMTVLDPNGGTVGTVQSVKDGIVVLKTNRLDASLPTASFTFQQGKLYFGMTQQQLNAEIEKTLAAEQATLEAAMDVGATVKGSGGNPVGTIVSADNDFVTIKLLSGKEVRIPKSGIAATRQGAVIGMSGEALEAQVAGTSQQ